MILPKLIRTHYLFGCDYHPVIASEGNFIIAALAKTFQQLDYCSVCYQVELMNN